MTIIIKNGTVVSSDNQYLSDIKVENGIITEIKQNISDDSAEIIDASGCLVFPGFIDSHTHFDLDNGFTVSPDDFSTGTSAAILGGTTTVLDFATQNKGETLTEALQNWHKKADNVSSCDYGFHMAITEWNNNVSKEIEEMINKGVTSFKLYMAYDNLRLSDDKIYEILKRVKEYNGIVGMHCENGDLVNILIKEQLKRNNSSLIAHPLSRPNYVEAEAIARYLYIAKLADAPVNIVHLSTAEGLEEALRGRERGQEVYIETCPQYLLLDDSNYNLDGFDSAKYILSPPLRKRNDINKLWEAISKNYINTIGTDHCSFNIKGQKDMGKDNFSKIPNGIPGVQHRPVLMYTYGVCEGKMTNEQMCSLLSENIAKLFGMYPKKGTLSIGSDADIVVWNKNHKDTITVEKQSHNVDNTPYEGFETIGKAEHVLLRGQHVVKNGDLIIKNQGKYVYRSNKTFI